MAEKLLKHGSIRRHIHEARGLRVPDFSRGPFSTDTVL
jgi:hypothetical protein